ncbi:hypothetical protein V8D89_003477 [Ganoderma adspersum]
MISDIPKPAGHRHLHSVHISRCFSWLNSDPLPRHVVARSKSSSECLSAGIPFDVACAIAQELSRSYDYSALRQYALVCRDWTSIAQQQLFRSVTISLRAKSDHRELLIPPTSTDEPYAPKKLLRFLDLLDRRPHLARFVQYILIHSSSDVPPTGPDCVQTLRTMLSKTTRLRSLNLFGLDFFPEQFGPGLDSAPSFNPTQVDGSGVSPAVPGSGIAIDRLDFWNCTFHGTRRPFFELLSPFSRIRIRHLRLRRTRLLLDGPSPNSLSPDLAGLTIPEIESITLHAVDEWWELDTGGSFLLLLHAALCAPSAAAARGPGAGGALTTIRLRMAHPSALDRFLLPCLRDARAQLHELYLDIDFRTLFRDYENPSEYWVTLSLRLEGCTALESLTLVVGGPSGSYGREEDDAPYAEFLRAVLRTYARVVSRPPPAVRSTVVNVGRGFQKDKSTTGELERFAFVFDSWEVDDFEDRDECMTEQDRARIADALESVLPRTAAKGVLRVELNSSKNAYCF